MEEVKKSSLVGTGRPGDMIEYQEGSVVSRALISRPAGNITLFAFAEGEGLSEHTAPFDALVHVLDGRAQISIDAEVHTVEAGEMLLMPANHPHALKAVEKFKMMLIMIKE